MWIYKYSPSLQKGTVTVIQKDSEATKVLELQAEITKLERILGQKQLAIEISMCSEVYENAHIKWVNGTIKNQYLIHRNITNFNELTIELKKVVYTYNNERSHSALGNCPHLRLNSKSRNWISLKDLFYQSGLVIYQKIQTQINV